MLRFDGSTLGSAPRPAALCLPRIVCSHHRNLASNAIPAKFFSPYFISANLFALVFIGIRAVRNAAPTPAFLRDFLFALRFHQLLTFSRRDVY
jgi:hypothetical protein